VQAFSSSSSSDGGRVLRIDRSGLLGSGGGAPTPARLAAVQAQAQRQSILRASVGGSPAVQSGPPAPPGATAERDEDTPLASLLRASILGRGPLSMADFMSLCLSHPQYGYYMQGGPVFGRSGDFVTSPEISQLFGELVGVWCVAAVGALQGTAAGAGAAAGATAGLRLVEGGPGHGTLASAVLRVLSRFPTRVPPLEALHLVETSPALRRVQAATLGCGEDTLAMEEGVVVRGRVGSGHPCAGLGVHWWSRFEDLPRAPPGTTPIALCHELFDALPVHQLVWSPQRSSWREILVDTVAGKAAAGDAAAAAAAAAPDALRNVLSPGPTPASAALAAWLASPTGARYRDLCAWEGQEGDVFELSPASQALASTLARRVVEENGAALVIDYGTLTGARALSLRGIRRHAFVDPLLSPGRVDLSADVDFQCLRAVAEAGGGVAVLGPCTQGAFLQRCGLGERLQGLLDRLAPGDGQAERLVGEARRLAHPEEMGGVFKVMAIVPQHAREGLEGFFF